MASAKRQLTDLASSLMQIDLQSIQETQSFHTPGFLRCPAEIRERIYNHHISLHLVNTDPNAHPWSLALACRHIYYETKSRVNNVSRLSLCGHTSRSRSYMEVKPTDAVVSLPGIAQNFKTLVCNFHFGQLIYESVSTLNALSAIPNLAPTTLLIDICFCIHEPSPKRLECSYVRPASWAFAACVFESHPSISRVKIESSCSSRFNLREKILVQLMDSLKWDEFQLLEHNCSIDMDIDSTIGDRKAYWTSRSRRVLIEFSQRTPIGWTGCAWR